MDGHLPISTGNSDIKVTCNQTDKHNKDERLKRACAEFESIFIHNLLKTMRESIPKNTFLPGGFGEEVYTSMLDQEIAKQMATGKGMGIGEKVYQQLTKKPVSINQGSWPGNRKESYEGKQSGM